MELKGKNILVTGGGLRVGRAIALALGSCGANVCVHYGRSKEAAEKTVLELKEKGVQAWMLSADLSNTEKTQELIPAALKMCGSLDGLVNSAALFTEGSLETTTPDMWDREMAVNLKAPYLLTQAFVGQLSDEKEGVVINMSDARINRPNSDHFVYRLTKSALADMTRNVARELAPRVRVNALALGSVLPAPQKSQRELDEQVKERVPLQRSGSVDAVGEQVVHFFRSDFLTGVVFPMDGGEFV